MGKQLKFTVCPVAMLCRPLTALLRIREGSFFTASLLATVETVQFDALRYVDKCRPTVLLGNLLLGSSLNSLEAASYHVFLAVLAQFLGCPFD